MKKDFLKKLWWFIWEDDSFWSWIVNIILAYVIIKFIVYPGLGLILSTSHPIVAVVSSSMEHSKSFDNWWLEQGDWYIKNNLSREEFQDFQFINGFNKGDIMVLRGKKYSDLRVGEIIVFRSGRPDPIIHRIVRKWENNGLHFQTKGDNNQASILDPRTDLNELDINEKQIIGKAFFRIPFLGYIKIWAVNALCFFGDFSICLR